MVCLIAPRASRYRFVPLRSAGSADSIAKTSYWAVLRATCVTSTGRADVPSGFSGTAASSRMANQRVHAAVVRTRAGIGVVVARRSVRARSPSRRILAIARSERG